MTSARHPAKSPPPKIVVANERYGLAPPLGCDPSNKSRTPPCTMSTERVRSAPMPNHHEKDLTGILVKKQPTRSKGAPFGTLDEGCRTVKQTTYSLNRPAAPVSSMRVDYPDEAPVLERGPRFSPRWRKIEIVPFPLSTVTSPGSSASSVITRYSATANGPGLVR